MSALAETGPHDWKNYEDYWRDIDAEWLQARSILRVTDLTTPATGLPSITSPGFGQVVFVKTAQAAQKNILFMYTQEGMSGSAPGWVPYPALPKHLYASVDDPTQVLFGHHTGNPATVMPAVSLSPAGLAVVSDLTVRGTVLKVTLNDIQIKTGATTATLTTDATSLVSNVPIKAPSFASSGTLTATGALTAGAITGATVTSSGAMTASTTLSVTGAATMNTVNASGGFFTGHATNGSGAQYLGDVNGADIRSAGWTLGKGRVIVRANDVYFQGPTTHVDTQFQIEGGRSINYYNTSGTHVGHGGGVWYSATAPVNAPNGTIWIQP